MKYVIGDFVQVMMEGVMEDCEVLDTHLSADGIPFYQVRHLDSGDICDGITEEYMI